MIIKKQGSQSVTKSEIIQLLKVLILQQPKLNYMDYKGMSDYRKASRKITQQGKDAAVLIDAAVARRDISAQTIVAVLNILNMTLHTVVVTPLVIGGTLADREPREEWVLHYALDWDWSSEYREVVCVAMRNILAKSWYAEWDNGIETCADVAHEARQQFGLGIQRRWFS